MKLLVVISGWVGLVTLVFLFYYTNPSMAGVDLAVKPTAETTVAQKIYLPLVQKVSPPLSDVLKEKYLLVEHWTAEEWGDECPRLIIDFSTYYFNSQTGDLFITINPVLLPTNMGYLGYGISLVGAGGGVNSRLSRVEAIPYEGGDATLQAVAASGQITMTHQNEVIILQPGTGWVSSPVVESGVIGIPQCVITTTHRLTNYGFQERRQIVTN